MTPLQIETLCETIEKKWIPIVENGGYPAGGVCTLCEIYFEGTELCDNCPICEFTNALECCKTPYYAWYKAEARKLYNVQELAIRMLLFLVSLLPGEPTYEKLREQVGV